MSALRNSAQGLYDPAYEHDSCGVGFVCHLRGVPSRQIVTDALQVLENMNHRGACGCEVDSGDGAGILVGMPDGFLRRVCRESGIILPPLGEYACGVVFLPTDMLERRQCERLLEQVIREYDMQVLGWRDVPVDNHFVGPTPRRTEPKIRQIFVAPGQTFFNRRDFDRRLYFVRQRAENLIEFGDLPEGAREDFYICVMSSNRLVYKGMLTADQLRHYFLDLQEPDFISALAMVHSRFSTNTFPSWRLAHPFRYLAHNGEINTLRGNRNWMRARYATLESEIYGEELQKMIPILTESGSDSATLDNAMQFLAINGRSLSHAVLMLIPEAWENNTEMDPELRAFYEYHACLMEPWDGPASISFTNGYELGAVLDRNGLRPSRYYVTSDEHLIMASEVGVLPIEPEKVVKKWRLEPGKIFMVNMREGRIVEDSELKEQLINKRPWKRWTGKNIIALEDLADVAPRELSEEEPLRVLQHVFGCTNEDVKCVLSAMASQGAEAVGSMGNDAPLACLSDEPQLLYAYFKQLFAQVTNPPLDAIREELVTSLYMYLGRQGNLLAETPEHCRMVRIKQPILNNQSLDKLLALDDLHFRSKVLKLLFSVDNPASSLEQALAVLCDEAQQAVSDGVTLLVLSDRGVNRNLAPIPALLAVSAVHHHLVRAGTRTKCSLIVETGEAREAHHFCLLIGYGASAVNPYLAFESIKEMCEQGLLPSSLSFESAAKNYIKAANKAILKVASKMGISTVQSYCGAQIFEAVGLGKKLIDQYFTHTSSRLGGIGLEVVAEEALLRHRRAYPPVKIDQDLLHPGGVYQWRRDGEQHMWNPETVAKLQHAVRSGRYQVFKEFSALANDESRAGRTIRGMLTIRQGQRIPLEEVEPSSEIVKRFVTGAMSFGSISREAHETLAVAMNRLGGKSNTGEGGEDPERFVRNADGSWRRSAIKQVASGRFGVTTEYLINADEIQIKMAQGAKPGEGGQLPGHKVDDYVGRIRHSTPGVQLISPPPHHDIYSIEDLAQLIHDLKNANQAARISVKLVSEVGVGTVAAGVAKAKADHILVSGDSGGTGASPLTSIKYAGLPWELGLAETQQTLVLHRLRSRVVLQTDGQLKTGRDVVIAALLGADEVGFATAPLISLGCVMMRVCHLNTCPVGIATQDPELRQKFAGKPEHVERFMLFVAEEVRELMAEMGFRKFEEMVGRSDLLEFDDLSTHRKARHLDLSPVLHQIGARAGAEMRHSESQDHGLEQALDVQLLELSRSAIDCQETVYLEMPINNTNRTVGAMLSGAVVERYGFLGLAEDSITCKFSGSAGQSFGAFLAHGVTLILEGDANDYLGKGLSGGKIIAYPPRKSVFAAQDNIIAGNVIGYGAVSGEIYLRGIVGERFCVRNSGVHAVVEGCGDHGCEYMTGGRVVVIGRTGRNFAAGMSGGIAYVYDPESHFHSCCNTELVALETLEDGEDSGTVFRLLERHFQYTQSPVAEKLLLDWQSARRNFVKVLPHDYRRALEQGGKMELRAKELSKADVGVN